MTCTGHAREIYVRREEKRWGRPKRLGLYLLGQGTTNRQGGRGAYNTAPTSSDHTQSSFYSLRKRSHIHVLCRDLTELLTPFMLLLQNSTLSCLACRRNKAGPYTGTRLELSSLNHAHIYIYHSRRTIPTTLDMIDTSDQQPPA